MALSTEQKSSRLFKKLFSKAETLVSRDFFEEPYDSKQSVLPSQIWYDEKLIPLTAPILNDEEIDNVVQYFEKLELSHIPGSQNRSYYNENLKNTISFNYGDGTYNYKIYKNDGTTQIAFGQGDWLLDIESGILTFYGTLPTGVDLDNPPKISFYKYVGEIGILRISSYKQEFAPLNSGETIDVVVSNNSFNFPSGETISLNSVEIYLNGILYSYGITNDNVFYTSEKPTGSTTLYFNGIDAGFSIDTNDLITICYITNSVL